MRRENPAAAEAKAQELRAKLFASHHFRDGALFHHDLMVAQAKQSAGEELNELDRTVLGPPTMDDEGD